MLRGTRENISFRALISNCAGVIALCFLLFASTVVIPQGNLHSALLPSAYAQQAEEAETGTAEAQVSEEEAETGTAEAQVSEEEAETGTAEAQVSEEEALTNLQRIVELAGITDPRGIADIIGASDSEELAEIAGASDSEELAATPGITDSEAIEAIAGVQDLEGLAELVGLEIVELLRQAVPQVPPAEEPPTEEPPTTTPLTAEISSNDTGGEAPATIEFDAIAEGGVEPLGYSWDLDGDGSEDSDEQSVVHTFNEAGTYTVALNVTDSEDQTASDSIEVTVTRPEPEPEPEPTPLTAEIQSNANESGNEAPAIIEFTGNAEGGVEPLGYSWDFESDGTEDSTDQTVEHTFDEPGLYTVTLTVTDADQQEATDSVDIDVTEEATTPPAEEPPTEEPPAEPGEGGVDKWGIDELYATADGGPTWYILEQEDPTSDGNFYYGMHRTTTIDYSGSGVWRVDARSGTQEHGIRMHVDSPTGTWKNTEMTGYFYAVEGSDQFTMIARHGPSYHDNGGCEAYGYYGMTAIDGNVFFKKKLYHFNDGYTKRLAQVSALDNLSDEWIGMKFVVYDLPNGDVKLELWIDEGDMTNNWNKVTELVDSGNLAVEGGNDCSRDATDSIEDGTRASFRADNMMFDFKKLSVREIQASSTAAATATEEDPLTEDTTTEDTTTEDTTTEDTTTEDTTTEDTTTEDTTTEDTTTEDTATEN